MSSSDLNQHVFAIEVDEGEGHSPSLLYYVVTPHDFEPEREYLLTELGPYFPGEVRNVQRYVRRLDREPLILGKVKGATYWRRQAEIAAEGREMWRARARELEEALTALYAELHDDDDDDDDDWHEDTSIDVVTTENVEFSVALELSPAPERNFRVSIPARLRDLIERLIGS